MFLESQSPKSMGMDQYLLINTILSGMNIHLFPSYFDVNYRGTLGFDSHMAPEISSGETLHCLSDLCFSPHRVHEKTQANPISMVA